MSRKQKETKEILGLQSEIIEYSVWGSKVLVKTIPSNIVGINRIPQMIEPGNGNTLINDNEWPIQISCPVEVSDCNYNTISTVAKNYMTDAIVEIGVFNLSLIHI